MSRPASATTGTGFPFSRSLGSGIVFGAGVNHLGEYFTESINEAAREAEDYTVTNAATGTRTRARIGAPRTIGVVAG